MVDGHKIEIKFIRHQNCSDLLIEEICYFKDSVWPYGLESQRKWINDHLKSSDIHVLLTIENEIKAYACILNIELTGINDRVVYGIGGVCTNLRGKGHGLTIMKEIVDFIKVNKGVGLLFCKMKLVAFYSRLNFKIASISFSPKKDDIVAMIFNHNLADGSQLTYNGELF